MKDYKIFRKSGFTRNRTRGRALIRSIHRPLGLGSIPSYATLKSNYNFVIFFELFYFKIKKTPLSVIHLMIDTIHLKIIFLINK